MAKKDLPLYEVTLEDWDEGIFGFSLVKNPAIKRNFVYMEENKEKVRLVFSDEEKGEIVGAILVPDEPIYRRMNGQEFNVVFSKEVIEQLNERFHKFGYENAFTIAHEFQANGAITMLESWIKEGDQDKSKLYGFDEPDGTLFIKAKIDSDFIKQNIKDGNLRGFSVELDASLMKAAFEDQEPNNEPKKEEKMSLKEVYKNSVNVGEKTLLFNSDTIEKGTVLLEYVVEKDEDEKETEKVVPFNGEFQVEQVKYSAKDGVVTEVENIELTLAEKIDALKEKVEGILTGLSEMRKPQDGDGKDELVENVKAILTKLEEQSLIAQQNDAKVKEKELEKATSEFSVEAYEVASGWIDRFEDAR